MKSFLNLRQQLSSAVSAEYRRVWWSFKIPTTNQKRCQFSTRTVIGRRFTHLREYSSRFIGPALSLYRHMDPYRSLGHASVTHMNMLGQCTQIGRDQSHGLCYLLYSTTKYTAATPATTTGNKTIRVFVSELLQTIDQPNTNLATWHHLASSSINPAGNGASAFNSSTFNQALVFLTKTNQWWTTWTSYIPS